MPRMSKPMVGLAYRSAKSLPADGCPADFEFVLMSSSPEGVELPCHGDVPAGRTASHDGRAEVTACRGRAHEHTAD